MEIGPVAFAGECVSIRIGCASYNTSKPVDYAKIPTMFYFLKLKKKEKSKSDDRKRREKRMK